jgi:light-regulated signal transduction histidine kinase (bacteriophytochrome)
LETFCKLITDSQGNALKLIGTTRDVTQLKNYERELEKKIIELKHSNKDLEDFAYIASHDIQEPLRKIISFSERLKNKHGDSLEEDAKKYLDRIMAATKNARQLIDGLMDFSRVSREDQVFEKTDLNNLIQEVATELELKIEETETTILIDHLPTLDIIPEQIKRMFSNLLLNAIKFKAPTALPTIKIHAKKLSVADLEYYKLSRTNSYFLLTVEDNGIGFEDEYAEKIFEMFQRLHSKAEYPGAGIGLALCKKIVENHRGKIFSKSKLNQGTTFSVILPEIQH